MKVALRVVTEMCSASFLIEIKMLTEKKLFQEIRASWKPMFDISKKSSFLISIYLYNPWYVAALKTWTACGEELYFR